MRNRLAKGVSTIEGATAFTLTFGAYSAANDFVKPSIAPLEAATLLWKGIPLCTATVLIKTTLLDVEFVNLGMTSFRTFIKEIKFISKSSLKASIDRPLNGLKFMLPGR